MVNFDGRYGKFDICVKRASTRPSFSSQNCQYNYTIDAQQHGSSLSLVKDVIGDANGAQPGTYYIIVKGTTEASLNIAITEKDVTGGFEEEDPENFISRTLKAGVAVADRLQKSDS